MNRRVTELLELLHLERLPVEGSLFVSTWRSREEFGSGEPVGTSMIGMFARDPESGSLFHRLPADEVWHFYEGDPIRLILLHPDGASEDVWLGSDVAAGQHIQYVIPAGTWQAGELGPDGDYALFGCTMAPGFTGAGFEAGRRTELIATHPDRVTDIERLTIADDESTGMPTGFAT